jgi:hypothetical protein
MRQLHNTADKPDPATKRVPKENTRPECCQIAVGPLPRVKTETSITMTRNDSQKCQQVPVNDPLIRHDIFKVARQRQISRTLIKVRKPQPTVDVTFAQPTGCYRNVLPRLVGSEIPGHDTDSL